MHTDLSSTPSSLEQGIREGIEKMRDPIVDMNVGMHRGYVSDRAKTILTGHETGGALLTELQRKTDSQTSMDYLHDAELYKTIFGGKLQYLMHVEMLPYSQLGSEGYMAWDLVLLEDEMGNIVRKPVFKKAITSGGGRSLQHIAEEHETRLRALQSCGVPTVTVYGVHGATLYEELYKDTRKNAFETIRKKGEGWEALLEQLIHIAVVLDEQGCHPMDFLNDLIFDGQTLRYADAGADIGNMGNVRKGSHFALDNLIRQFRYDEGDIRARYTARQQRGARRAAA